MKNRVIKLIVCVAIVSCLMVGFCTSFASAVAESVLIAGAMEGALAASGISAAAAGMASLDTNAIWIDDVIKADSSSKSQWYQSVTDGEIKWINNYTVIEGINYDKVVLDNNLSSSLNYFTTRIIDEYQLEDGQTGTLFQYSGYYDNTGIIFPYTYSDINFTVGPASPLIPDSTTTVTCGPASTSFYNLRNGYADIDILYNSTVLNHRNGANVGNYSVPRQAVYGVQRNNGRLLSGYQVEGSSYVSTWYMSNEYLPSSQVVNASILYTNGTIDATLPQGYSYYYLVPSTSRPDSITESGIYTGDELEDAINAITEGAGEDNIISGIEEYNPDPPVPPVPVDTPLGEVPYQDFLDTFGQSVYDKLDGIDQSIDTAGQNVIDGLSDVEGAIDTAGQSVVDGLSDVEVAVDTAGQSVVDSIEAQTDSLEQSISDVADKVESLDTTVDQVIEKIESHPLDLFGAFLDRLTQIPVLRDFFDGIKQHVGIWHYVVEWLQCIGTFLTFFIGLFADVAYCMVVPIYACVAGAICLSFYKRFGR